MKKLFLISLLFLLVQSAFAQTKTITGTVKNKADGIPIPGVTVLIKGTTKSSVTDFDGKYSIVAEPTDLLVFSYIGFLSSEIKTSEKSNIINANLSEELNSLDEVVVLGSTVRVTRKELGNSVTSIKAEGLNRAKPVDISSALQGKIAGAQVSQNSGDPAGGFSIKLRGTSSILGSSDPLYVIDGVVLNNASTNLTNLNVSKGNSNLQIGQNRSSDINPNDIETIEVLNGGAAAAIYGSRAANGVILITTKKGRSGDTKYTFSTSLTTNSLRKKVYVNQSDKQFVNSSPALFPIQGQPASPTTVLVAGRNLETQTISGIERYDYQDDVFVTGIGHDTYFSLRGGDDKTKYFSSIGYLKNEGIIKNTDYNRLGAKLKIQHEFNSKLTASVGLNYITSNSNEKPDGNVFWSPINSITITNNIYDINQRNSNGDLLAVDPNRVNPLSVIETFKITQKTDRMISDIQLNFKPFENFNADFIFGLDNYNQKGTVFIPRYPYSPVNGTYFNDGYVSEATNRVVQFNNDLNLRYLWNINKKVKLTSFAGYNVQSYRDELFAIEGRDLKPFVQTINAFNTLLPGSPSAGQSKYNLWGFYLQETIGFNNKFFVTIAGRQDASTVFSKENRSQFYPKVSASYVLSDEKFMDNSPISSARLRGSWGESGSLTAITPYARFTNYSTGNLVGNTSFTLEGFKKGNLDLRPEKSSTYEVGADLGILKDRVNLSFSYYNADIKDLLLPVELASSTGSTNTIQNIGQMNNKGVEIGLRYDVIKKEDFNLDFYVNYSSNRNKVTGLPQQRFKLDSNPSGAPVFVEKGQPIGIYYGTYYARNTDGTLLLTANGYPQVEKGDSATGTALRDASGQPTGTILNKQIGNPNPDYIISFGANLNYKKFGMSILFDGVQGVDVFDADYRTRQGVGNGELVEKELNGELPRGYIWSIYGIEEFRVVDGNYIKLREVSLSYSFGKLNSFFDDLTINASGRNLFSWDKFTSFDPETNSGGQSSVAKYNFGTVPIPRSFSLALKFQF
ncbi:SusC/RagA family TonB-linked outer membrane protein [Flavobacterium degerlachei]|jgi:TonB-linked SusC/RagA family outer membrane protein|uniref:TonB-linked outer membrane protein, SusC/RagA family n=1 Tax=Flavobacterium degerlachei TaxID=229203 RepID=A0A1H2UQJ8_9FLAO|nr:SusC/RagA family TonB-linked outer membrane protein [Flavobacterium degerlachei]SDW58397.1 TonB-linked outer membrane protein, SusC/RagA family [Flavobacterium degerlachei]